MLEPEVKEHSVKRRIPAVVWILLPLALGLLYALVHSWVAPDPNETNMPPSDAVLVFRYRDFDAVDAHHVFAPLPAAWSVVIGAENNVPGLPGVDRSRPLYEIKLPPNLRFDSTVVVFPLEDPDRFERAFLDPTLLEKERTRRPKEMQIHGSWGAVGPDLDSVARVGTGTLVCDVRGEAWSLAVDVPGLVQLAMAEANQPLWKGPLGAFGIDFENIELDVNADDGSQSVVFSGTGQLWRIAHAWETVRLWSYPDQRRVEAELTPAADSVVATRMAALAGARADARPPPPAPREARMWLWVPGVGERALLVAALHAAGVDLPDAWTGVGTGTSEEPEGEGGVLVFGGRASGHPYAVTIGVVAPEGALPDLSAWLGTLPEDGSTRPLARGAAPLTVVDTTHRRPSPSGDVRYRVADGLEMVGIGAETARALDGMQAQLAIETDFVPPEPPGEGWHLVAAFHLGEDHAAKVLGPALGPGGLLASLESGIVDGALWSNGRILRLEARVTTRR